MTLFQKIKSYFVDPIEQNQFIPPSKERVIQFVARCEGENEGFFLTGERLQSESITFRTCRALLQGEEVRLDVLLPSHGVLKINGHVDSIQSSSGGFRGELKLNIQPHQRFTWDQFREQK